jgi:hypothetical protein
MSKGLDRHPVLVVFPCVVCFSHDAVALQPRTVGVLPRLIRSDDRILSALKPEVQLGKKLRTVPVKLTAPPLYVSAIPAITHVHFDPVFTSLE